MEHKGKQWFQYRIVVHPNKRLEKPDQYGLMIQPNHYHSHSLKVFNFPSEVFHRRPWFIRYWIAKMQVRFPMHKVTPWLYPHFPDENPDEETQKKRQISAAKAQVTKVENIIRMRRDELSKELFNDETNDPVMIKARGKLAEKQFKLNQLLID